MGDGDDWPAIREKIVDAMLSETDDEGRPIAYNRVAGVVVTGNEDGAHHVIAETAGSLIDIGFTVPGQAWTYCRRAGRLRNTSAGSMLDACLHGEAPRRRSHSHSHSQGF
jgi:hypothetical protein